MCNRITRGERRKRTEQENLFKGIMTENYPNLLKNNNLHIWEGHSKWNKCKKIHKKTHHRKYTETQKARRKI